MASTDSTGPFATEREARAFALEFGGPPREGWSILSPDQNLQMLLKACETAGVPLGAHDESILGWLAGFEDSICAVVAALVLRAALNLGETERWTLREARETLARWDEDRSAVGGAFGGYDTERVLADHLRTVLALIPEGSTDGP